MRASEGAADIVLVWEYDRGRVDRIGVVSSGSLAAVFSSTYDILTSWFVWIRPERPRDDLTVLERRSRDGYGGGGSVITTSQASTGNGGGVGDKSGAAMVRAVDQVVVLRTRFFDSALDMMHDHSK